MCRQNKEAHDISMPLEIVAKRLTGLLQGIAILLITLSTTACSSDENQRNTSTSKINIHLHTDSDVNPNEHGQPAPLKLYIYGVKSTDAFENSDFFSITEGNSREQQLSASQIFNAILQPGQSRTIALSPPDNTVALGFIAAYRDIEHSQWMSVWPLPKSKKKHFWQMLWREKTAELDIRLKKTAVITEKMD